MFGFCLARLSYLNVAGNAKSSYASSALPGEWYHYRKGHYRIGITLHLVTIIPAGLLMVFQFVPIIRHKAILFHRINGYLVILLVFAANAGALMIAKRAFGGTIVSQTAIGTLAILTAVSVLMAYYNIKRLQIEQHRAWMLRTMFYLGTIITMRLIMILSALVMSKLGGFYEPQSCGQIAFSNSPEYAAEHYPACASGTSSTRVVVDANMSGNIENVGAALAPSAGMALWLAILMHLIGVEIYLALTPKESERLRRVSYERQLEAGFKYPGSAGTTIDRWGDAEKWTLPASQGEN